MSKIYLSNILYKEQREVIKHIMTSFIDGNADDIFEGSIEFEPTIEERMQWDSNEIKAYVTSAHLKIDVIKTNPKLTECNPLKEIRTTP